MKRFIIAPVGLLSLVLLGTGCFAQSTERTGSLEDQSIADGVHMVGIDSNGEEQEQINAANRPSLKHSSDAKKKSGDCGGCGPLPDPWKNGPLPDPWTVPPNSSSSSGGSSDSNDGK